MTLRIIIVDDEPLARERIRTMLEPEKDCQIVAECGNGPDAVEAIRKHSPDLVFLDVQMPGMDGFEVLRSLKGGTLPLVIFVTAYDQHALKAFEVHALDYLLKPFKQTRFKETLARARETLALRQTDAATRNLLQMLGRAQPAPEYLTRIPVPAGDRIVLIKTSEIEYIEAAGNYAILHVGKESHILRETLTSLEGKLDPKKFLRINRSTIVSLDQIREFRPLFEGEHAVLLRNGKQFTLTRGLREAQERLKFA